MKKESTALGTRLALATKRVRSRGKQEVLGVIRGGYRLLPEPAKELYRRIRGKELLTPAVRIRQVTKDSLPSFTFGSITGGRIDWAEKWQSSSRDKRVLLIAPKDFAGSMYKWTEALNRHSQYAARLVTFEHHQYGYPVDLVVPECDEQRLSAIVSLADEAGLLHLKDEHSWFLGDEHFTNLKLINTLFFSEEFASWPKIFTHYGGYARKFKADPRYIDRVSRFDSRIAMTPDLNYEWFSGEYIPHTIDIETIPFAWVDGKIFAHSPSSPEKKATYLFEEAMVLLPQEHPAEWEGWRTELIHGVSFAECMRRKQQASLFFDQAGRHRVADLGIDDIIGWYGNSAIEAMAFGIPTMAHMSDFALERAAAAQVDLSESPVINIERTRKSLMDEFLKFARAGNDERFAIAQKTRAFTESFHGYDACATRLAGVYSSLTSQGKRSGHAEKISSV
ncbi:hypothetical protein [Pseudaminobacter salicylatoxidans]|uniref:hypothetical protein n=1 Tax=Pseudaminobacter salicylatoxidans TaxID=93369 RepID=UPI000302A8AD|nr:hypothetical protein [Pseudaminobacter salicylatoxidans]